MNMFSDIRVAVIEALEGLVADGRLPEGLDFGNVAVEPPRDPAHGDMATNAAMVLAKPAGLKPREIAEMLAGALGGDARIASAEVAGPGFLNLRLAPDAWRGLLRAVHGEGAAFGRSDLGQGRRVNVEFVSANPTGPMHVGHTRGAVFGDALARLLAFSGHEVTREYYINDGGAQVDVLARSVYLRYLEALGRTVAFEEGTYPGDYLVPVGEALAREVGEAWVDQPESIWLAEIRDYATDAMMAMIREDLALLGVEMDVFYSEKSLYGTGRIEAAIEDLKAKGLIYEGVLEPPKGKTPEDWEPRVQTLFKSTEHGDDVDRPVMKSDGSWTYFAPDIAYHYDKITRGFDALIDVFGADHGGYVKRMKAAVAALSEGRVPLDIKLMQLVKLKRGDQELKMSKRAGTFVTLARRGRDGGARRHPLRHADAQERHAARFRRGQGTGAVTRQPGLLRAIRPRAHLLGHAQGRGGGDRAGRAGGPVGHRRSGRVRADRKARGIPASDRDGRRGQRASSRGLLPLRPRLRVPRAVEQGQRPGRVCASSRRTTRTRRGRNSR
jgi:arginyl-tRNA synthetase